MSKEVSFKNHDRFIQLELPFLLCAECVVVTG